MTDKKAFYDRLLAWTSAQDADSLKSLVMTGDFNIAPRPTDVWDPELFGDQPSRNPQELARWEELCDHGLEDVGLRLLEEGAYTFWDYRGGAFQKNDGMRIDHFLLGERLQPLAQEMHVHREWRVEIEGLKPSDHAPVELQLSGG